MPSNGEPNRMSAIQEIADILACPACKGTLQIRPDAVGCMACGASFLFHEGIPLFARKGSVETWGRPPERETSEAYQENYEALARAERYNQKYQRQFFKRMSTRLEHRILEKLLVGRGHCSRILDIPSGGGRLSTQIAPAADLLIEADIALGQVLYARDTSKIPNPQVWMTASAFHLPFKDRSIDGTVCVRLCHHLPSPGERERLVRELLRVSRRFVIMTFFDENSPKNLLRRTHNLLGLPRKSPKLTMRVPRLKELAREAGADLAACPYLTFLGSGHRYALMVRPS